MLNNKQMKGLIIIILLLMFTLLPVFGENQWTFDEVRNPFMICVDAKRIYLSDKQSVFVYNRADGKLIKQLCKKGEGPGELIRGSVLIALKGRNIFLSDSNKLIQFNERFELLREIKLSGFSTVWEQAILGEKLVFTSSKIIDKRLHKIVMIKDLSNVNLKQKVAEIEIPDTKNYMYPLKLHLVTSNKNLFIVFPRKKIYIEVFDKNGHKVRTITYNDSNIKGKPIHKKRMFETLEESFGRKKAKRYWLVFKNLYLPDIMPSVKSLIVDKDILYIQTYDFSKDKDKWLLITTKGKFIKSVWLPKVHVKKVAIFNGVFFYLRDTDDGWKIFTSKIK